MLKGKKAEEPEAVGQTFKLGHPKIEKVWQTDFDEIRTEFSEWYENDKWGCNIRRSEHSNWDLICEFFSDYFKTISTWIKKKILHKHSAIYYIS
jgi:hypothetical protein